ncbi:MAG: anthranilate synthase component I [Dehalococcoidia bacterium]|nr:anthranilate synthase component I [Dehalococcoidia bacterium]
MRMSNYYPSLEEVKGMAGQGNLIPFYREINADLETPVSAYLKIAQPPYSFLLESVEGGERLARYSFIGTEPFHVVKTGSGQPYGEVDPLVVIQEMMDRYTPVPIQGLPRFHGGTVGYLSYDAVRYFERVPTPIQDPLGLPEAMFLFVDTLLVFDHVRHKIKVVTHIHLDEATVESAYQEAVGRIEELVGRLSKPLVMEPRPVTGVVDGELTITSNMTKERHGALVERIKEYIYAGDIIQAVLSQRLARPTHASPLDIYRALRTLNPSPYMYFLALDGFHIVGASPELLVRVDDGVIYNFPLAGTRPRGVTTAEDEALAKELKADEKERAEHIMLVDLGRNDVGRISGPGSVEVTDLMRVVRYSHVMHMESEVHGRLRADKTIYDALRSCLPAGTLSGAPKIRAMEILAELEAERRGPYGGAVGYFGFNDAMDTAITIRTMVLKDGVAYIQAGGGIVADSVPETEYLETLHKAQAVLLAIQEAEAAD